jgi:hypothetical protein
MRFVPPDDGAWAHDKINSECEAMIRSALAALPPGATASAKADAEKADTHPETGHPYWRFIVGATRFDLTLAELQPYIDFDARPETWSFRRLSLTERDEIGYLIGRGRTSEAFRFAFGKGVTRVENATGEAGEALTAEILKAPRDEAQLLIAAENYAATCVAEVGAACWRGSQDLTPLEKKL